MQKFIPIFPLPIVVYPGEKLNLHIFEPRYKQLINECNIEQKPFCIPILFQNELMEFATEIQLIKIVKLSKDGAMDISITGIKILKILEIIKEIPLKLYSGAIVSEINNILDNHIKTNTEFEQLCIELFNILGIYKDIFKSDFVLNTFNVAHLIGFTLLEEIELLRHQSETSRQKLILQHIKKILPEAYRMIDIQEKAKLNGQYRMIHPPNF